MFKQIFKINQSYSVAFADYVRIIEKNGRPIIKMQTGDPDFATHPSIVSAAENALQKGETKYCDSRGLVLLRNEIANKLKVVNKINASCNNILITHGAVHAISVTIRALVNIGDECIIIEPFWRSYESNIILCGGKPVILKLDIKNGFKLKAKDLLDKITNKTKLVIINTPNNPSGAVYEREELEVLAKYLYEKKIYLISDEVYESIIFSGKKHYSIGSNPLTCEYIISVFSFSKSHAMTGWRIGYVVASNQLIDQFLKLSQFSITSLSPFIQIGALEALINPNAQLYSNHMTITYENRRQLILNFIHKTWLEEHLIIPEATFYALIDVSIFNKNSLDFVMEMVDSYGIAFTPGIAFGDLMDNYIRFCFASTDQNIELALNSLIDYHSKKINLI